MTTQTANGRGPHIPTWTVGDRLRKARELAGLDQQELADLIGVARQSVSNYEIGVTSRPRRIVLNAWAMHTDVPVSWLDFGYVPEGPDDPGQEPAGIWSIGQYDTELARVA